MIDAILAILVGISLFGGFCFSILMVIHFISFFQELDEEDTDA